MHHLTKNETEYLSNLFDVSAPDTPVKQLKALPTVPCRLAKIDPACLRRINLLTAKERPFCSFCNGLTGFTWYVRSSIKKPEDCLKEEDQAGNSGSENGIAEEKKQQTMDAEGVEVVEEGEKLKVVG